MASEARLQEQAHDLIENATIELENDVNQRGALSRCLDAVRAQASVGGPRDLREEMSATGDELTQRRFRQFELSFRDGVGPFWLGLIFSQLCAATSLVDDSLWVEN